MKIKWTISPAPTGKHRSFQHRSWPFATVNGEAAFSVRSIDRRDYSALAAKTPVPNDIIILIAVWRNKNVSYDPEARTFDWRRLKGAWSTLAEAKAHVADVVARNPGLLGDMPPPKAKV